MSDIQAGIKKKSFELNYAGGTIWCEHLDGMGDCEEEVISKFTEDRKTFGRPSLSSFMIINLDETVITEKIADTIVTTILDCPKRFRKIAFVGVDSKKCSLFGPVTKSGAVITFLEDYEKAKQWMF